MTEYRIGYKGQLHIVTKAKNKVTYPEKVFYSPPFKLTNYFKTDEGIEYMLMNASAGIMSGDDLAIDVEVGADSNLRLSSQSYEKIHKMENGSAKRITNIRIACGGYFCYNQLPIIPFTNSMFINQTNIQLENLASKLVFSEILACGRSARNERFAYKHYHGLLNIYCQEKLVYRDNCLLKPETMDLSGFGLYEGYSHMGMMIVYGFKNITTTIDLTLHEFPHIDSGVTQLLSGGYLIRSFANNAEILVNFFTFITKKINSGNSLET